MDSKLCETLLTENRVFVIPTLLLLITPEVIATMDDKIGIFTTLLYIDYDGSYAALTWNLDIYGSWDMNKTHFVARHAASLKGFVRSDSNALRQSEIVDWEKQNKTKQKSPPFPHNIFFHTTFMQQIS